MVQSLNSVVDLVMPATSGAFATRGNIMIGNRAIEFYNSRNPADCIQIPWDEVDRVAASVMFKGTWIPRFAVLTKSSGTFSFSARDSKRALRAMKRYISDERMVRSLSFLDVVRRGASNLLFNRRGPSSQV
ncbi:protein of unknown function DUF956 [Coriobacterium glomerans PW2]|uniref:DUF956 family protein n=1 Tax=Coriobacterium glomerans (strain ATCC 49209 / DSM 20642 / JCM 10262 / PW2) TaxID=700015 RepID=F2N9L9_CORGP|nr:DUF956 family protein [Coriobacterium glomerans]AEB07122.1 protein of unknown function DUF956 [Coriobacterium glomerans PW2]